MSLLTPASPIWRERMLAVLRIVAGLVFFSTGTMMVFGFPYSPQMPPFELMSQMGIGKLLEVIGGAALVLGLFTRPVAFLLAGEMAVAYWQFHAPESIYPTLNNGVSALLYCFLFLYLAFAGGGAWSVDNTLAGRRNR
jgi:putative oxidoreductase